MSAIDLGMDFQMPKNQSSQIKVMGIGGGGSNAVNYMFEHGIKGVDFVICNTDLQALEASLVPTKIQLGANLTEANLVGANVRRVDLTGANTTDVIYEDARLDIQDLLRQSGLYAHPLRRI
mgnify:CR=1 FL=1